MASLGRYVGIRPGRSVAVLGCAAVVACGSAPVLVDPPLKVQSHDLVGSVHVAILANQDWEGIKGALKPNFEVSSKDALAMAIPATQTYVDRAVRAIAFGFALDLGERSATSKVISSQDKGSSSSQTTSSSTQTDSKTGADIVATAQDKDASAVQSSASAADSSSRSTVRNPGTVAGAKTQPLMDPTKAEFIDRSLGKPDATEVDPVLRHRVAADIYQEIQTLNRYIDAAARRSGYRAEFVRLQVSLMPRSPRLPYDAYVNISFFASCLGQAKALASAAASAAVTGAPACSENEEGAYDVGQVPLGKSPMVVPLLVTDNIESTLASRNIEAMRQVALGLAGVLSSVGLKADYNSFDDRRQALLGRSFNSIMTIGHVADNTIRVRLGAINQGPSGQRMVPRTHDVSLVVLVPNKTRRVAVTSKTEFMDPDTAEIVPARSSTNREQTEELHVARKYDGEYCFAAGDTGTSDGFKRLSELAFIGDQEEFNKDPESQRTACHGGGWPEPATSAALHEHRWRKATYVWADMISLIPGSRFNHTVFDIDALKKKEQAKDPANVCPPVQTAILRDDGAASIVVLPLGQELVASKLSPLLQIATTPSCRRGTYAALAAKVDDSSRVIGLTFPSLHALGISPLCAQTAQVVLGGCVAPAQSTSAAVSTANASGSVQRGQGHAGARKRADGDSLAAAVPPASRRTAGTAEADPVAIGLSYAVSYVAPKKSEETGAAGQSTLRATSTHVTLDENDEATIALSLRRGSEKVVYLSLRGADIAEQTNPGVLQSTESGLAVVGSGTATVALRNLHEGRPFRLFLADADGKPLKTGAVEVAVLRRVQPRLSRVAEAR